MPYLNAAENANIYYEDFGKGIPILFVHAGSSTHDMWESQVDTLAHSFRTITWDWRGVGLSDKPSDGYDVDTVVGDLGALIDGLGLERVIVVGHGLGAHIAILAEERFRSKIAGLALTSAAPWNRGDYDGVEGGLSTEFIQWQGENMGSAGMSSAAGYAALFENWLFHSPAQPADLHAAIACAIQTPLYVMNRYRASFAGIDHRQRAGRIQTPTLILQGRHDRKQRYSGAVHLQGLIPGARLHTFENSAHMPHVEEMQRYNQVLADFAREATDAALANA
ncbi:alpha/beta hydrolase [Pusillimonas sp. SM2304]|uniref:alpha/beta fold hydrolase n=1 Tax=Pusillimonas sp. SM2304 TaxID=3073241 RepID=UPI002876BE73|nr:alpha/beta hydrolase [Pusillimonas sp. SM2304]MDS1140447.1 alpha/beta hydrolase [Pusillimonas sp. SM2304]